ncbi:MAG: hypothetical protein [Microvirus sp.]|nr:MAG: hypothetical protein [Microvirus sp.]
MDTKMLEACRFCKTEFNQCKCGLSKRVHDLTHKICSLDNKNKGGSQQKRTPLFNLRGYHEKTI